MPVAIDVVVISPLDLIAADQDGFVIVPQAVETSVVRTTWNKVNAENQVFDAIRGGMFATVGFWDVWCFVGFWKSDRRVESAAGHLQRFAPCDYD